MSDDDFLIDDEIYALATTGDKKRKKRPSDSKGSARKRARTEMGSDMDESDAEPANPYPLEGKYKSEADRQWLNEMPEMQREEILAQRQEELQVLTDKLNLTKFLASQRELHGGGGMADDSVAQAAKRKRTLTGSAKEKAHTRDALKANRKAKEERRAHHTTGATSSPSKPHHRDSGSSDMDTSSDEEEPVFQRDKYRNKDEREKKEEDKKLTVADLSRIQLTRAQLSKEYIKPWFEDYVKGAWVRYLIGNRGTEQVYRLCEIKGIGRNTVVSYSLENESVNHQLELAFGRSVRLFNMDKVSNSAFTEREFNRLVITCETERVSLPTLAQVQRKRESIKSYEDRKLTEADVSTILARRRALQPQKMSLQQRIAEGARLRQEYNIARARNDKEDMTRLREELDKFNAQHGITDTPYSGSDTETRGLKRQLSEPNLGGIKREGSVPSLKREGSTGDSLLEELSKRNRQLNHENARRLQVLEAERRKKAALERIKKEEEETNLAANPSATTWTKEQEMVEKNPELANKDIGTKMAHMIEIELPDF